MSEYNIEEIKKLLETMTLADVARHLKISYQSLDYFCKANNIKPKIKGKRGKKSETAKHVPEIISMYADGMCQVEIAEKIGISRSMVKYLLEKNGQKLRSQSDAASIREANTDEAERKRKAAAANAVRHAMSILNLFC